MARRPIGRRPKPTKLALNTTLRTYVEQRLAGVVIPQVAPPFLVRRSVEGPPAQSAKESAVGQGLEPGADCPTLADRLPGRQDDVVSHEAIYQALFVQGRGALRRELSACLRTGRVLRVPRARVRRRGKSFVLPEINQSTPRRSGRSCGAGSLGRRPHPWSWQLGDRHAGWSERHASRCCCIFPGLRGMAKFRVKNGPALGDTELTPCAMRLRARS